jgi:hypothetical protein
MFLRSAIVGNEIESAHWSCWVKVLCTHQRAPFCPVAFHLFLSLFVRLCTVLQHDLMKLANQIQSV